MSSSSKDSWTDPQILRINYDLEGSGWATITVVRGDIRFDGDASYVTDALADLIQGAIDLIRGGDTVIVRFMQEPGELRFVWRRAKDAVRFVALQFSEFTSNGMDESRGDVEFDQSVQVEQLCRSVFAAASWVRHTYGTVGYLAQWSNAPFPTKQLQLLRHELEIRNLIDRV